MKKFVIVLSLLVVCGVLFADQAIIPENITPMSKSTIMVGDHSTPILVSADANWRGIVQPGRNVSVHGDTICVIYSNTTSDPNNFQRFTQAYSVDGGATWTPATVGTADVMRTYPHHDVLYDVTVETDPLNANPYIYWLERLYPTNASSVNFSKDDLVPYSIFSPIPVDSVIGYFPTVMAWGLGDTLFGTAADVNTDDIYAYRSEDNGVTWVKDANLSSTGSNSGQVAAMVDNGQNGFGVAFYAQQAVVTNNVQPYIVQTTDYGQTWSSPETLMYVTPGQPLSMTWQGYSCVVDPVEDIPYFFLKLDTGKDCSSSYNYGELYFIKPNGGTPGAYTFDYTNAIGIVDGGTPGVFEHLAGYPTMGFYRAADSSTILYGFFNAFAAGATDTTLEIFATTSTDQGVTWNEVQVTDDYDTAFQKNYISSSYYINSTTGEASVIFCLGTDGNDTDHLDMYHFNVDVVADLGLPTAAGYETAVEEGIETILPNLYKVTAFNRGGVCSFNVSLPDGGNTSLQIFDATGREVSQIVNTYLSAGVHNFNWNSENSSAGNYIYRMTSGGFVTSGKVLIAE